MVDVVGKIEANTLPTLAHALLPPLLSRLGSAEKFGPFFLFSVSIAHALTPAQSTGLKWHVFIRA